MTTESTTEQAEGGQPTTAVAVQEPQVARALVEFDPQQIELIKRTIAKGTTNEELSLFIQQCRRTGLDPFSRQIYCIVRGKGDKRSMTIQTSIDGLRTIAQRTGGYQGQTEPEYRAKDGGWSTEWDSSNAPYEARVGVYRSNFRGAQYARARYSSYVQMTKEGNPNSFWKRMPELMLAKCAESLALRKAFPNEMSGLYTSEEMGDQPPTIEGEAKDVTKPVPQVAGPFDEVEGPAESAEFVGPPHQLDEKPKKITSVKGFLEWTRARYGYDRKTVYTILGDIKKEDDLNDIGLLKAGERIRDHHDNPKGVEPDKPVDGEFREED